MNILKRVLICCLTVFFASSVALRAGWAQEENIVEFAARSWSGFADFYDDGSLAYCAVEKTFAQETVYFVAYPDGGMSLALENDNWSIPEDEEYDVFVSVDGSHEHFLSASGDGTFLFIFLDQEWDLYEALRKGVRLRVDGAHASFTYPLRDTAYAFEQAMSCVKRNTRATNANPFADGQTTSNPFRSGSSDDKAGQGQTQKQPESSDEGDIANYYLGGIFKESLKPFLEAAGVDDPYLLNEQEIEDEYSGSAFLAWRSREAALEGFLTGSELKETVPATLTSLAQQAAGTCTERFAIAQAGHYEYGTDAVGRVSAICDHKNYETTFIELAGVLSGDDIVIVFVNFSSEQYSRRSEEIADKMAELLAERARL